MQKVATRIRVVGLALAITLAGSALAVGAQAEEVVPEAPLSVDPMDATEVEEALPPVIELKEVEIVGRRLTPSRYRGSTARTVIEREEIEAKRPQAIVDLLRERAGVDVRNTGGPGKTTGVFIRGANPNQVRVLIDGVLVGSATLGSYDWSSLSSLDIDRIVVHRGPQTARFGAGAMGGVVEVFTREPEPGATGRVYAAYGNEGQRTAGGRVSAGLENGLAVSAAFEHTRINGVSAFELPAGVTAEVDPFRNTTSSGQIRIPTGEDGRARLFWRRSDSQNEIDDIRADNLFSETVTRRRQFGLDWEQQWTENWVMSVLVAQHDDRDRGEDPFISFNNFDIETKRRQARWVNDLVFGDFALVAGVDLEDERATNADSGILEGSRRTGLFAEFQYDTERVGATAGVRREFNNRTTDEWTYQLGGRVTVLEGLDVVANFGTAFRAPTLNELFFTSPFAAGNPELEPERSRGGDVGLRWVGACECGLAWNAEVRAFHLSFENLIQFVPDEFFFFTAQNETRARTSGVEASFRIDWEGFWISGAYTNLRSRDALGVRLARRPRHAGRLSIGMQRGPFRGEVVVHAVGRTFSLAGGRSPVEGRITADVFLGYEFNEHLALRLDVRNVTSHDYQEVAGFSTLGRTALVTVEAGF